MIRKSLNKSQDINYPMTILFITNSHSKKTEKKRNGNTNRNTKPVSAGLNASAND